jgi:flagellar hook-associated protein 2
MSAINFTGLASGLDTDAIIKGLMEVERQPLKRLEAEKEFQEVRLGAYEQFQNTLKSLNDAVGELYLGSKVRETSVSVSGSEVTASVNGASPGSFQVAVEQLAQVQKSVTQDAFASRSDGIFGTGSLTLTAGDGVVSQGAEGTVHSISIDESNNSLSGIMEAINSGTDEHGITAAIIDNGNEGGDRYYLMLTGADSSTEFTLESSLSGGEASMVLDPPVQNAQDAVAYIDGVQVTSKTNTIEGAVSGLTLNLASVSPDDGSGGLEASTVTITTNTDSLVEKMEAFANAYNEAVSFVTAQSQIGDSSAGILAGDVGLNSAKRRLQNLLTTPVEGNQTYQTLSQLGFSTNRDGTVNFDKSALESAMADDFGEVARLMAGDDNVGGIFKEYRSYLNEMTSSRTGFYAMRQETTSQTISRIDDDIVAMEARIDKREQMYLERFAALEQMISMFNAQSDYLTQQMDNMPSFGGKD